MAASPAEPPSPVGEPEPPRPVRGIELLPDLPIREVHERIRYHGRQGDANRRAQAFYLYDLDRRGAYQQFGSSSAIQYAVSCAELDERTARGLLQVGRAIGTLQLIDLAFAAGEIPWSALRAMAWVAEPENQTTWLDFAKTHTADEVAAAAGKAKKGALPPEGEKGPKSPRSTIRLGYALPPETYHLYRQAMARFMRRARLPRAPARSLARPCASSAARRRSHSIRPAGDRARPRAVPSPEGLPHPHASRPHADEQGTRATGTRGHRPVRRAYPRPGPHSVIPRGTRSARTRRRAQRGSRTPASDRSGSRRPA